RRRARRLTRAWPRRAPRRGLERSHGSRAGDRARSRPPARRLRSARRRRRAPRVMSLRRPAFRVVHALGLGMHRATRMLAYVAVGFLDRDALRRENEKRWSRFGVDPIHVESGLMTWEERFYDQFVPPGAKLLLVGAGSGRDLIALLKRGHDVDAAELSERAAAYARGAVIAAGL